MIWRALGAVLAGTHRMAEEMVDETLAEAAALDHPMTRSYVVLYGTAVAALRGSGERLRAQSRLLSELYQTHGFAFLESIPGIFEGYVLARHDGEENGVRLMRDCIEARCRSGSNLLRPMYLGMFAEASLSLGDIGAARRAIGDGLGHADLHGEVWYVPELHRKQAQLALAASPADPSAAERALKAAARVARQHGAAGLELRALRDLQTLWDSGAETEVGGRAEYRRRLSALARSVPEKAPLTDAAWREPHRARLTD
jgi:predicted ATPase